MSLKKKTIVIDDLLERNGICRDVRKIILRKVRVDDINESHARNYVKSSTFSAFFSNNGENCVIIREDHFDPKQESHIKSNPYKCRRTHMLTWNLKTDEIIPGQWLLNKKLKMNCNMLSPNGEYFAYTMSFPNGPYKTYIGNGDKRGIDILTIISKPPYFTGITVLRHDRCPVYGDVYERMKGANWINDDVLLLKSKAKIESGKKPNDLKLITLKIPDKVRQDHFYIKKDKGLLWKSKSRPERHVLGKQFILDLYKRRINLIDGKLLVNDKEIYDFALDKFKFTPAPSNYFVL